MNSFREFPLAGYFFVTTSLSCGGSFYGHPPISRLAFYGRQSPTAEVSVNCKKTLTRRGQMGRASKDKGPRRREAGPGLEELIRKLLRQKL
jgi:hypothetical protein